LGVTIVVSKNWLRIGFVLLVGIIGAAFASAMIGASATALLKSDEPKAELGSCAAYSGLPSGDRVAPGQTPSRVIKGGSYLCSMNYCSRYRPAARQPQENELAAAHLGFRTVLNKPNP
jgi:hypothetical protein